MAVFIQPFGDLSLGWVLCFLALTRESFLGPGAPSARQGAANDEMAMACQRCREGSSATAVQAWPAGDACLAKEGALRGVG